jgi:hypothetical protein
VVLNFPELIWRLWNKENLFPLLGIKFGFPSCLDRRLITLLTEFKKIQGHDYQLLEYTSRALPITPPVSLMANYTCISQAGKVRCFGIVTERS